MVKIKSNVMTMKEIDIELSKIYKERMFWSAINKQLNYKIPEDEIRRREFILFAQYTLYKVEDAKKEKNKMMASFNSELYKIMKEHIGEVGWQKM